MVRPRTIYCDVLFKFCNHQEKKKEKTMKMPFCSLINNDLILENIISYCFLRFLYLRLRGTYPVAHAL